MSAITEGVPFSFSNVSPSEIDEPPEYGEITFRFEGGPVSIQAAKSAKAQVTECVRAATRPFKWLLDDHVSIDIAWHIPELERFQTDRKADLDNVLKPLLDGFCGPDGVLVDDSFVMCLSIAWHVTMGPERLEVTLKFDPDHFLPKDGLMYVCMAPPMCYPVPGEFVRDPVKGRVWLASILCSVRVRRLLEKIGVSQEESLRVLPPGFVHRSRVASFGALSLEEFRGLIRVPRMRRRRDP